ncbi:MAG: hypothetical protein OXU41_04345 [Gammaproteobacteria bacterium]|nr:hypothetical protein [Gammaproteobacteria bacterium]MDD9870739.1 hypothetical protein [Gammaproteobacteria bacterium]
MRFLINAVGILSAVAGAAIAVVGAAAIVGIDFSGAAANPPFPGALFMIMVGALLAFNNTRCIFSKQNSIRFLTVTAGVAIAAAVGGIAVAVYGVFRMQSSAGGLGAILAGLLINMLSVALLANIRGMLGGANRGIGGGAAAGDGSDSSGVKP